MQEDCFEMHCSGAAQDHHFGDPICDWVLGEHNELRSRKDTPIHIMIRLDAAGDIYFRSELSFEGKYLQDETIRFLQENYPDMASWFYFSI